MLDPEFTLLQDRIVVMADLVRFMDLPAFIRRLEATRKMAPMLDQAIYADLKDYEAIIAVAKAALDFKLRLEALRKDWRRRHSRRILKGEL